MVDIKFNADIAIIGGTGLYQLADFNILSREKITTPWGEPSSDLLIAEVNQKKVIFLTRHGEAHNIPPHKVNYRANLWALKESGVTQVVAVAAVGGITERMSPETIVIPDQIIDYTYGREHTYFSDDLNQVTHIDFTEPYTESLRQRLISIANNAQSSATYAATQGPRLETAAEVQRLKRDGADIVGMTGMPEAALAREAGLQYACCALVVNWGAGCAGTRKIEHSEMLKIVDKGMVNIQQILKKLVQTS